MRYPLSARHVVINCSTVFCFGIISNLSALTTIIDDHDNGDSLNGPNGLTWSLVGVNKWSEPVGSSYITTKNSPGGISKLLCNYANKNDGTLEVTITYDGVNEESWYGGVIFRYSADNSYYFVYIARGSPSPAVRYTMNTLPSTSSSEGTLIKSGLTINNTCVLKIVLSGNSFSVYTDNTLCGTITDDGSHPAGKFGYGYIAQNDHMDFEKISWTEEDDSPVLQAPYIKDTIARVGTPAAFFASARGAYPMTFNWQQRISASWTLRWSDTLKTSGNTSTFSGTIAATDSGLYRAVIENTFKKCTTATKVLVACNNPANATVLRGNNATFNAPAFGYSTTTVTYQWQNYTTAWTNLSGQTSSSYSLTNAQSTDDGKRFRCVFTRGSTVINSNEAVLTVDVRAKILSITPAASPYIVKKGSTATFTATIEGKPAALVRWMKYNTGTTNWDTVGTSATYSKTADIPDEGSYKVRVVNQYCDTMSTAITLQVYDSPVITSQPRDTMITSGGTATFSVTATGYPLTYQWQLKPKGGSSWSNVSTATGSSHSLTVGTSDDSSSYRCIVKALVDSVFSDSARVFIIKAPTVTISPAVRIVNAGSSAAFTAAASGAPAPTVAWERKVGGAGWVSTGVTGVTYTLASAAFSDSGYYRAVATNMVGSAKSDSGKLIVCNPPSITSHPRDTIIILGATATFSITATGYPLTYQWQKKTGAGQWLDITLATAGSYSVTVTADLDSVLYRCRVKTLLDSVFSNQARLVIAKVPTAVIQPLLDTVNLNQLAIFTATVSGVPAPGITWERNVGAGWVVMPGKTALACTLSSVTFQDSGSYRVRATNFTGSTASSSARLLVCKPPVITAGPKSIMALSGTQVVFSVAADGYPLSYQWQKKPPTQTWVNLPSATTDTVKYNAATADDGTYFRCIVSTLLGSATSDSAKLSIGYVPVVTSKFTKDNPFAEGQKVILTGSATGTPTPSLNWYFVNPSTPNPVSKGTGDTLMMLNTSKSDSGFYYFVATNTFGSANSDTAYVHVLSPVRITTDLTNTYTGVQGGTMKLSIQAAGDGTINYQWYRKDTLQIGKTSPTFELSPIDSLKHKRNTFYCEVWNSAFGKVIGTGKSTVCTLLVGIYFNPFSVTARKIDKQHIELGINAQQSIKSLLTDVQLSNPWCDTLWVLYKTKTYPKTVNEATVVKYSTSAIKAKWPDTTRSVITVPELLPASRDSSYFFSHTVLWHQQGKDTLLTSFVNAAKVFMLDTGKVKNPLAVTGIYIPKSDSALLIVGNINLLADSLHDSITVECSRDKGFSSLIFVKAKDVATLLKLGKKTDTLILDSLGTVPFEKDTIYCRWNVRGKNGLKSAYLLSEFQVGQDRPVFTGVLRADSTNSSTQIRFQWTMPDTGIDSMRVWYDTKKSINIGDLPSDLVTLKPFNVSPYGLVDTLDNLSDSTKYYVWAQIHDDGLWSRITPSCTATVVTAHGDTATIFNTITIDTAWFDDITNWIFITWNIDTTLLPPDMMYQYGYTYSLDDTGFLKERPKQWDSVYQGSNSSVIKLGKDLWFDTVYTAGLWLRGKNLLTGKTTQPAMPTAGSRRKVKVGPFTWEIVTVTSVPCPDTEYVANRKIILRTLSGKPFDYTDTVRAYRRGALPGGFVPVGGVPFRFTKKSPEINDFVIGMRYAASLPQGVTKNRLRLYRDIGGYLCVLYGSYEENGIVWAQVGKNDLLYPFLVLADTAKPRILPQVYSDTVDSGALKVETGFKIRENAGNLWYEFMYGAGDKGYSYTRKDTLKPGMDSIVGEANNANDDVVSASFGLRARLIVRDGVDADTEDVSRVVRSGKGEAYPVNSMQWTPLRVTLDLDNNGLIDSVFNRSTGETSKLWQYDKTKQRIFRYYRPGVVDTNDWTEYAESLKEHFAFSSGRVIWLKSAKDMQVQFGGGVTQSLKKPYMIDLKPGTWTDFSLPYQFYVMLRDVLESTGPGVSKELEVYQWTWKETEKVYTAEPKFIGKLDNDLTKVKDTLKSDPPNNAYLVYNHDVMPIKLVIPPVCLALSKYTGCEPVNYSQAEKGRWVLGLQWLEKAGSGYSTVLMGCNPDLGAGSYYGPLPPGLGVLRAGVINPGRDIMSGYGIQSGMADGGLVYTVGFSNSSDESKGVSFRIKGSESVPEGYSVRVLNPETMRYEESGAEGVYRLMVGSQEMARRVVVVGSGDYFDAVLKDLSQWSLQFVKAYPNPFRGMLRIYYTLPEGIKEVLFTVYDMRGRALWRGIENKRMTRGVHIFTYDGRRPGGAGGYLSSGMYIIRMSAKNSAGRVIYAGEKRITCIR